MLFKLDTGSQVDVAVLDFSKAFDTAPHERLLQKLEHCGIDGPLSIWIKNFLCYRKQCHDRGCQVPGGHSIFWGTTGGRLRPLCCFLSVFQTFHLSFIRKRPLGCLRMTVWSIVQSNSLHLWGQCWGMRFNEKKCNIINLGKKHFQYLYQLNGVFLEVVSHAKYLGVTLMKIYHGPRTYRLLWPRRTNALASSDEICRVAHSRVVKPHTSAWSSPTWIIVPVYGIPMSNRIWMTLRRSNERQHAVQEVNTASSA